MKRRNLAVLCAAVLIASLMAACGTNDVPAASAPSETQAESTESEAESSEDSTEESKGYSRAALQGIIANMDGYLQNIDEGNAGMLLAANTAGKAINITQTTAGHAMCYKITSLFGCAHGHAAALCDRILYPWMVENIDKCIDPRGKAYLAHTLDEIGQAMGCEDGAKGAKKFIEIFDSLELAVPTATDEQFELLKTSVNPVRLKNHPIALDDDTIDALYHDILNGETQ